jgi:hypothetical protein
VKITGVHELRICRSECLVAYSFLRIFGWLRCSVFAAVLSCGFELLSGLTQNLTLMEIFFKSFFDAPSTGKGPYFSI